MLDLILSPSGSPDSGRRAWSDWLSVAMLLALFVFSWKSVGVTRFNALDTPLFLCLSVFCLWHAARSPLEVTKPALVAYLLWASWVVFADFFSTRFAAAFARDAHWLLLPLFALQCARIIRDVPAVVPLLRVTAAISLVYIALHLLIAAPDLGVSLREPVFGHIRHLSLAVGALVIWLYGGEELTRAARIVVSIGRFAGLAVLFWAGGRGALLAVAAALLLHFYLVAPARKRAVLYLIEAVAAAVAAELASAGNPLMGLTSGIVSRSITAESADALSSRRLTMWSAVWERLSEGSALWAGRGGNGYMRMGLATPFLFHPHNVVLQILTDWGVIGLVLFANFLGVIGRGLSGLAPRNPSAALAASIMVYLLITGLIDGGLYHLQFLISAALAFAMIIAQRATTDAKLRVPVGFPIALILAMVLDHLRLS
jgi:O-antigen ligase